MLHCSSCRHATLIFKVRFLKLHLEENLLLPLDKTTRFSAKQSLSALQQT